MLNVRIPNKESQKWARTLAESFSLPTTRDDTPAAVEHDSVHSQGVTGPGVPTPSNRATSQQTQAAAQQHQAVTTDAARASPSTQNYELYTHHRRRPCMILAAGAIWADLRCPYCATNTRPTKNHRFIKGISGFKIHISLAHKDVRHEVAGMSPEQFVQHCKARTVSPEEVLQIEAEPALHDQEDESPDIATQIEDVSAALDTAEVHLAPNANARASRELEAEVEVPERVAIDHDASSDEDEALLSRTAQRRNAIEYLRQFMPPRREQPLSLIHI